MCSPLVVDDAVFGVVVLIDIAIGYCGVICTFCGLEMDETVACDVL